MVGAAEGGGDLPIQAWEYGRSRPRDAGSTLPYRPALQVLTEALRPGIRDAAAGLAARPSTQPDHSQPVIRARSPQ